MYRAASHNIDTYLDTPVTKQLGFTLFEMVVALTILGVLGAALFKGVTTVRDFDHYNENRVVMDDIRNAMLTYIQVNGFLPCPDTDDDGVQNREAATPFECSDRNGTLPYLDLGTAATDVWGQPFRYSVNARADASGTVSIDNANQPASFFNNQSAPAFNFNTRPYGTISGAGNLTICADTASNCNGSTVDADKIEQVAAVVVVSYGVNGLETWSGAVLGTVEAENEDNDRYFWQSAANGADDQLIWLNGYDVKSAIIKSAGQL